MTTSACFTTFTRKDFLCPKYARSTLNHQLKKLWFMLNRKGGELKMAVEDTPGAECIAHITIENVDVVNIA